MRRIFELCARGHGLTRDREDAERGRRAGAAAAAGPAGGVGADVGPRGAATGRSIAARSSGTRRGSGTPGGRRSAA